MSHFTVLVIGENPEEQLAPFQENNMGDCPKEFLEFDDKTEELEKYYSEEDEETKLAYPTFDEYASNYHGYSKDNETGKYGYWDNPNKKWDWYSLGGRWTGFFKVKDGGEPGIITRRAEPGYGDQLLKRDIDFDTMRNQAGLEAQNNYEFASEILEGAKPMESWKSVRERIKNIDEAQEFYHAQERVLRFKTKEVSDKLGWGTDPEDFSISKEQYINNARNNAGIPFAVIKDGKWYEKGSMGWWGIVSDENEDWAKQYAELIDSISDDTLLSLYDCHI